MDSIIVEGKSYISVKRASEITGYTKDYIGQLCRSKKVLAVMPGRTWWIDEASIVAHSKSADESMRENGKQILERPAAVPAALVISSSAVTSPVRATAVSSANWNVSYERDERPLLPELKRPISDSRDIGQTRRANGKRALGSIKLSKSHVKQLAVLTAVLAFTGASAYAMMNPAEFGKVASGVGSSLASKTSELALNIQSSFKKPASSGSSAQVASVSSAIGSWLQTTSANTATAIRHWLGIEEVPPAIPPYSVAVSTSTVVATAPAVKEPIYVPAPAPAPVLTLTPSPAPAQAPRVISNNTTIYRTDPTLSSRVDELESSLDDFKNFEARQTDTIYESIGRRLSSGSSGGSSGGGSGSVTSIDASGGTTGLAFTGGPVTSAGTLTLSGVLDAANGGTGSSTYSAGEILYGDGSGSLTGLYPSSNGLVLKLQGGVPTWAADISGGGGAGAWATTSDNLAVFPSDPSQVVIVGSNATTSTGNIFEVVGNSKLGGTTNTNNLIASSLSVGNLSGVLLGTNGAVSAVATSSLGLPQFSDLNSYLTTAAAASTYLTQANAVSTYLTQANAASTYLTQANAASTYLSQANFNALDKGFFFSTTSATYFLGQNQGLAFSTTSASNFLALNQGNAFSTTSADYWKTQRDLFSTTSADAYINASSTIAHPAGGIAGNLIEWDGSKWVSTATSSLGIVSAGPYLFSLTGNATSTLTQFNGGLTAFASSTIGNGAQAGGLTINGGATTTGNAYVAGNLGVGASAPRANLEIQGSGSTPDSLSAAPTVYFSNPNVNHGITQILPTNTFGKIGIDDFDRGTLGITGISNFSGSSGIDLTGYLSAGGAGQGIGAVSVVGWQGSGTARIAIGSTDTVFNVSNGNSGAALFDVLGNGNIGIGTTSPYAKLSVDGNAVFNQDVRANYFTATSTSVASVLPYASSTALTVASAFYGPGLINCNSGSNALTWNNGAFGCNTISGTGGSSGTWSTTTSQVPNEFVNYSNGTSDVVAIGSNSTTTAKFFFDPNIQLAYLANASTTVLSASTICLATDCRTSWPTGGGVAYPFALAGNATSTLTQFNGGLTAFASSTIGNGLQNGGLTINGGATTTGAFNILSTISPQFTLGYDLSNYVALSENSTGGSLLNFNGSSDSLIVGFAAPANVSGNSATFASTTSFYVRGANGGNTTISNSPGFGGGAGGISLVGGTGGQAESASNEFSGSGGALSFTGGTGGAATASGASGNRIAGDGGDLDLTAGTGGAAQNGFAQAGGLGGAIRLVGGLGGSAVGSNGSGGNGGDIILQPGAGGTGANGGPAGNVYLAGNGAGGAIGNVIFGASRAIFNTANGFFGIGTTSPYAMLSVDGRGVFNQDVRANYFTATSTSVASVFPYASTTVLSASTICLSTDCRTAWPSAGGGAYPFALAGNATSTLTQFNGGLTAFASSTIGNGLQNGGLTINGGATTTGDIYLAGALNIGGFFPNAARIAGDGNGNINFNSTSSAQVTFTSSASTGGGKVRIDPLGSITVIPDVGGLTAFKVETNALWGNPGFEVDTPADNSGATVRTFGQQTIGSSNAFFTAAAPTDGLLVQGSVGIGTTSPYAKLSVDGNAVFNQDVRANYFTATSTTLASVFPYASTTALSASTLYTTTLCLSTDCRTAWPAGYEFGGAANSTSTLVQFNGGLTAYASSTIGDGTQGGGLAINGGATTTGALNVLGNFNIGNTTIVPAGGITTSGSIGIGTTSPWRTLSVTGSSDLGNSALAGYFTATSTTSSSFAGGFTASASSTIGNGGQGGGLTISGGATTTGTLYLSQGTDSLWIGTTSSAYLATLGAGAFQINVAGQALQNVGAAYDTSNPTGFANNMFVSGQLGSKKLGYTGVGGESIASAGYASRMFMESFSTNGLSLISDNSGDIRLYTGGATASNQKAVLANNGSFGIGTTSPWRTLSVTGSSDLGNNAWAGTFTATSTTVASVFPYASTTVLSASTLCIATDCRTAWPSAGGSVAATWSTTTSQVAGEFVNFSNNNSDVIAIGSNSTTTAKFFFDPNTGNSYIGSTTGIGTASSRANLEIRGNGYSLDSVSQPAPNQYFSNPNVNHGLSGILPVDVFGRIGIDDQNKGTLGITGISHFSSDAGVDITGYLSGGGSNQQTPAVSVVGWQGSGTGRSSVPSTNTIFAVTNGNSSTPFNVMGSGSVGIGTSSPFAALSIQSAAATGPLFAIATTTGVGQAFEVAQNGTFTVNTPAATSTINGNLFVNGTLRGTNVYSGDLVFANNFRFTEADPKSTSTPSGMDGLYLKNQDLQDLFSVDKNGNLTVTGDVCANGSQCYGRSISNLAASLQALASSSALTSGAAQSALTNANSSYSELTASLADATQNISALSSKLDTLASTTADLRLSLDTATSTLASSLASSTADALATSTSFITTIANAVKDMIQSAGEWVIAKLTAHVVIADRVETQVAAVSQGFELTDQVTGQIYCVSLRNGDFARTAGACGTAATSTAPAVPMGEFPNYLSPASVVITPTAPAASTNTVVSTASSTPTDSGAAASTTQASTSTSTPASTSTSTAPVSTPTVTVDTSGASTTPVVSTTDTSSSSGGSDTASTQPSTGQSTTDPTSQTPSTSSTPSTPAPAPAPAPVTADTSSPAASAPSDAPAPAPANPQTP